MAFGVTEALSEVVRLWYPVSQLSYYTIGIKMQQVIVAVSLFVTMYMESKNLSLKDQLAPIMGMLFFGNWFGLAIGKIAVFAANAGVFAAQNCDQCDLYRVIVQFVTAVPSVFFLVFLSFTALSLAHIRKH